MSKQGLGLPVTWVTWTQGLPNQWAFPIWAYGGNAFQGMFQLLNN
jgi:hypothetical protein